jgi:glycosyltransferase involved in cell wall biosynthesis
MRVLHLGNVANNGWNNAKLLRRIGVRADAVCDELQALAQPEWEEAVLPRGIDAMEPWADVEPLDGWQRPEWVLGPRPVPRRPKGYYRVAYALSLARAAPRLLRVHATLRREYEPLRPVLGAPLELRDVVAAFRTAWMHGLVLGNLGSLFRRYDLVQTYATHAVLPLLVAPGQPYVAFEHGTLREIPFENSWRGRLTSLAFLRARRVLVTNADVLGSIRRLGLEGVVFVPHPVDETKYTPGGSAQGAEWRSAGDHVLLAPSRQDWREKGQDRLLRAFAELVRGGRSKALLVLGDWGLDGDRSRALVRELGLEERVQWLPPVPKLRLIDAYRAADVVLDQFVLGTFGGITPEAMACGRPSVVAFDPGLHAWAFPEPPPVVPASTEAEILAALTRLLDDPAERERVGAAGRAWIERHHSWRLVAERQRRVYEEVLATA